MWLPRTCQSKIIEKLCQQKPKQRYNQEQRAVGVALIKTLSDRDARSSHGYGSATEEQRGQPALLTIFINAAQ